MKKDICLPPNLFESVISKGIEICWPIPHEHLKICLSNREALNWMNIDLTHGVLCKQDFLNIAKSDFPIKQLSFRTKCVTHSMLDLIKVFAPTIEVLEISRMLEITTLL